MILWANMKIVFNTKEMLLFFNENKLKYYKIP